MLKLPTECIFCAVDPLSVQTRAACGLSGRHFLGEGEEEKAAAKVGGIRAGSRLRWSYHSSGGEQTSIAPTTSLNDWQLWKKNT